MMTDEEGVLTIGRQRTLGLNTYTTGRIRLARETEDNTESAHLRAEIHLSPQQSTPRVCAGSL